MKEKFEHPQRQSKIGILLIFIRVAYNVLRGTWVLLVLLFVSTPDAYNLYGKLGILALFIIGVIYSYFYYRNYLFHIDFENHRFVLQKGVFSTQTLKIPFDKIQQVDLKRSILQRVIGVYGLSIDTAGSKSDEVHIRALSEERATALSSLLTTAQKEAEEEVLENLVGEGSEEPITEKIDANTKVWDYHLPLSTLLKIGLTKSYLRGFLLVFGFALSIYSQLEDFFGSYMDEAWETSQSYWNEFSGSLLIILFLIFFVLIVSVCVTVLEVIIKHFDLRIFQTKERMEVEMGLKTNTKVSFQARRLQLLQISTNPIQKKLNLYEVQFSLASSQDELQKSKIKAPGLNPELIKKIKEFLYDKEEENIQHYKPHKAWPNRRYIFLVLGLIPIVSFTYLETSGNWATPLILALIYLLILVPYQYFVYKSIKIRLSDDFLVINQGLWTQVTQIVELYKLEGVSISQPFWYRRRNIYNLVFHTAGGDMKIRAVPHDFVRQINYMLYKVESSEAAWM